MNVPDVVHTAAERATRRVLAQDDAFPVRVDLDRVFLLVIERPAQLPRERDAAELVDLSDDSCCFHIKNSLRTILPFV